MQTARRIVHLESDALAVGQWIPVAAWFAAMITITKMKFLTWREDLVVLLLKV
jgi:hypothetical protein